MELEYTVHGYILILEYYCVRRYQSQYTSSTIFNSNCLFGVQPQPNQSNPSERMAKPKSSLLYWLCIALVLSAEITWARTQQQTTMKSAVYLSPEFVMEPGSVANKFYYNIDFPMGHIGLKSFNAEVVDEFGVPVPLHDTYLHHWLVVRYYLRVGFEDKGLGSNPELHHRSDFLLVGNSGLCDKHTLGQYFGLGSETRKTATYVPDPYAIEVGNSDEVPPGYEERWLLNVHAIDTRGVVDRLGCTECRCDLYNVTVDEYGRTLSPDYEGGLYCCYDQTQCKLKEGSGPSPRKLYLRYTVKWYDWDESLLPVKIYIFDITDTWKTSETTTASTANHHCKIEYEIEARESSAASVDGCTDSKRMTFVMPRGGYMIYGVAHQHSGGIGTALYRKDGQVICSSMPFYGMGQEAGNETGYIVGMSTCYPHPGSVELLDGETLVLESNYSSSQRHTGVMGLFYILVADQLPSQRSSYEAPNYVGAVHVPVSAWVMLIGGLAIVALTALSYRRNQGEDGYQAIST